MKGNTWDFLQDVVLVVAVVELLVVFALDSLTVASLKAIIVIRVGLVHLSPTTKRNRITKIIYKSRDTIQRQPSVGDMIFTVDNLEN